MSRDYKFTKNLKESAKILEVLLKISQSQSITITRTLHDVEVGEFVVASTKSIKNFIRDHPESSQEKDQKRQFPGPESDTEHLAQLLWKNYPDSIYIHKCSSSREQRNNSPILGKQIESNYVFHIVDKDLIDIIRKPNQIPALLENNQFSKELGTLKPGNRLKALHPDNRDKGSSCCVIG